MSTPTTKGPRCADRSLVPDPDLFFPISTEGPDMQAQIAKAKAVCEKCPLQEKCLTIALNGGSRTQFGVWGGKTEGERRYRRELDRRAA
ncbi:WhiB family transcriptional regulator [Streptosporangium sp. NPDC048865]|uniref:WhiB family transcriptional regulator n=1 Tax=Streptosporangium sp. NPDC048865 TaxID=3155766 RepID=UPI00341C3009